MEINAACRANIRTIFYKQLYKHPDLISSRIKIGQDAVDNILGILETTFIDPLSPLLLMCISTDLVAIKKAAKDMLLAETLGEAAMKKFLDIGLWEQRAASFSDPIEKIQHVKNGII